MSTEWRECDDQGGHRGRQQVGRTGKGAVLTNVCVFLCHHLCPSVAWPTSQFLRGGGLAAFRFTLPVFFNFIPGSRTSLSIALVSFCPSQLICLSLSPSVCLSLSPPSVSQSTVCLSVQHLSLSPSVIVRLHLNSPCLSFSISSQGPGPHCPLLWSVSVHSSHSICHSTHLSVSQSTICLSVHLSVSGHLSSYCLSTCLFIFSPSVF